VLALVAEQLDLTLSEIAMRKRRITGSRSAVWRFFDRHGINFKGRRKSAQNWLTRGDVVSHPKSSVGKRGPPSALRNGRGGALVEEFGSVTRRFPWSVIAIEALSPMVFIHTRRIIMVPGHQHLLGFRAPLFESHRRLVSYVCVAAGRDSVAGRRASDYVANGKSQHFDLGQEPLNPRTERVITIMLAEEY
jgi:hypothetical protein